jgi:hypothetical protein
VYNYLDQMFQMRQQQQPQNAGAPMQGPPEGQAAQLNVPFAPQGPENLGQADQGQQMDPALRAVLGIEGLSPGEKKRARQQAVLDELRGVALGGPQAQHWTGALAKGLAGFGSGYGQRKMEPEYEQAANERKRMMEEIFKSY